MRARSLVWFAAIFAVSAQVLGAEVEADDAAERLRATREWYGADANVRVRILDAAKRERDRYAIGQTQAAARGRGTQALSVSGGSFINIGPTRADFAINGDLYREIDSGRARQILPHPMDADVLYLSTAGGGVWKTYNARSATIQWEPLTDAIGTTAVGTLAMDPSNPEILFLGLGDPFDVQQPGITRSADGGGTWATPSILKATYPGAQLTAGSVTDIKVDPRNSLVVLATTDAGLFRSIDGGANWTHVPLASSAPGYFYMWSLAYAGNDTWLATGQAGDATVPPAALNTGALALFRSTDNGATWAFATAALPGGDATAQTAGRATLAAAQSTLADPATARIYLLAAIKSGQGQLDLFRTDDGGLSFTSLRVNASRSPLNQNPDQQSLDVLAGQAWYNQALLVDPSNPDAVFIGGQLSMIRSLDGGHTWGVLSDWLPHNSQNSNINRAYVHADLHAFAVGADGTFYAGSDGGIAVSPNARDGAIADVIFTSAHNEGLVTHLVYTVACAPETWPERAQSFVIGGLQDNGTRLRLGDSFNLNDKSTTFNQVVGGDGVGVAVSAGFHLDTRLQIEVPDFLFASVPGAIFRSTDGGQSFVAFSAGLAQLPFFVRIVRVTAAPAPWFLTFTASPPGVYQWQDGAPAWVDISGFLHWQDSGQTTRGFTTVDGTAIGLRNVATHPGTVEVFGAVSNRFTYMTNDRGRNWVVGKQPKPPGNNAGAYLLSSIELDPRDDVPAGNAYYISTVAGFLVEDVSGQPRYSPWPADFGHVLYTSDAGLTWTSLGVQDVGSGGLPQVGVNLIKLDPNDRKTVYAGTEVGLYRSTDAGATWSRFGAGTLPLVEVRDFCIAPGSQRMTVATYGRGFWQVDTTPVGAVVDGVRGLGDTNFDGRIDGEDLIDLADGFGATQSSPTYRWQADLIGTSDGINQADLDGLLAKFGGRP